MMGALRPTEQLIAMTDATIAAVERFTRAFNAHDGDAIMATMTDDCVFENTTPPPATSAASTSSRSAMAR